MPTVLVTGAAGFIGSHSVERLLAQGQTVLGVDNFRTGRAENLSAVATHPNFRLIRGDLLEQGFIPRLMAAEKPGAVLHLAALVSVPESIAQPDLNRRLNFEVTRDLAHAKVFVTALQGEHAQKLNDTLSKQGFRRSQNVLYRPSCAECSACLSARIRVAGAGSSHLAIERGHAGLHPHSVRRTRPWFATPPAPGSRCAARRDLPRALTECPG